VDASYSNTVRKFSPESASTRSARFSIKKVSPDFTAQDTERLWQASVRVDKVAVITAPRGKTAPVIRVEPPVAIPSLVRRHTYCANEDKEPLNYEQPPWRVARKPAQRRTTGLFVPGLAGSSGRIQPMDGAGAGTDSSGLGEAISL
jgi:hypothetical protein